MILMTNDGVKSFNHTLSRWMQYIGAEIAFLYALDVTDVIKI